MAVKIAILRVTNLFMINYCYLIVDTSTNSAVLIDPAWEQEKIEDQIIKLHANVCGILLTHHHIDHINLSTPLAKKLNVPVYMSKIEIDFYNFNCPNLIGITEFDNFNLGSINIQPILTPGHTKGGTSYFIENNFFSGDTLFIEGCGLCTGKGGDPNAMFDTLQMLKTRLNPSTLIYPGHSYGQPVGMPFEYLLMNNIYLHFQTKEAFVEFRMRSNQKNLLNFK